MDSFELMNEVISYIEENIISDIDFTHIAKIACCPTHQFQRIFAFITDTTLSDYIRRRRLSLAAIELQHSNISIIDVALKYRYDSHASFTRAFREHHKIAPSSARDKSAVLNILHPISFHAPILSNPEIYRVEEGRIKMAKLAKIEFVEFGPYKIVGKQIRTKPMTNDIPRLWGQRFSDGTYETLLKMKEFIPMDIADDYVGYVRDLHPDGTFTYLVGMLMETNTPVPNGFTAYDIPSCTIAKAWIQGEEYEIYSGAHSLTVDGMIQNGYKVDWEHYFKCEVYTDSRFGIPQNNGDKIIILDVYIPCIENN